MNSRGCQINRPVSHFGSAYQWGCRNLIATLGGRLEGI